MNLFSGQTGGQNFDSKWVFEIYRLKDSYLGHETARCCSGSPIGYMFKCAEVGVQSNLDEVRRLLDSVLQIFQEVEFVYISFVEY